MGHHLYAAHPTRRFSVGLYACLSEIVTQRSPNSECIEFRKPEWDHHHLQYPTWASKLNAFATMGRPDDLQRLPRIPCTEENARFFYDMLIAMCRLGRNLHEFFADPQSIAMAIERGNAPVLMAHEPKRETPEQA